MWFIPAAYAALLLVRLCNVEHKLLNWSAPLAHVAIWMTVWMQMKEPLHVLSQSPTMSWGLFALVVYTLPLLLNKHNRYPGLLNGCLLLSTALSVMWVSSLGVQLPTPMSAWSLRASWLFDLSGACVLLSAVFAWRVYLDGVGHEGELARWLQYAQTLAFMICVAGLLCIFQEPGRLTLQKQSYFVLLLCTAGQLFLPSMQFAHEATALTEHTATLVLSKSMRLWSLIGSFFILSWSLVRFFIMV